MKFGKVIRFMHPEDYVVINMIDKNGDWIEPVYEGYVIDVPWSYLDYPLFNDELEDIYAISARQYEEDKNPAYGFVVNIEEV